MHNLRSHTEINLLSILTDDPKTIESMGEGIEGEVIHNTLEGYWVNASHWFSQWEDGHCVLATTYPLFMAQYIPDACKCDLSILGAIVTMCLIHGMSVTLLDPILHYFIHECDLCSIHPGILGEWHPALKQVIFDWIGLGVNSNANTDSFQTHFLTYWQDLQVSFTIHCSTLSIPFSHNHRWPTCLAGIT